MWSRLHYRHEIKVFGMVQNGVTVFCIHAQKTILCRTILTFARERSRTDFTTKSTKGHEGWNLTSCRTGKEAELNEREQGAEPDARTSRGSAAWCIRVYLDERIYVVHR